MEPMVSSRRLDLRRLTEADYDALGFMRDPEVMYAWEHGFSRREVEDWIAGQRARYERDGIGYLLATDRETGQVVGQAGLLRMEINGRAVWDLGYILDKKYWGRGYATEAAGALVDYAFERLGAPLVTSDIRPGNRASIAVAQRLGMRRTGEFVKHYYGMDMVHWVFQLTREEWDARQGQLPRPQ